jgi:hypothetical protein
MACYCHTNSVSPRRFVWLTLYNTIIWQHWYHLCIASPFNIFNALTCLRPPPKNKKQNIWTSHCVISRGVMVSGVSTEWRRMLVWCKLLTFEHNARFKWTFNSFSFPKAFSYRFMLANFYMLHSMTLAKLLATILI